MEQPNENEISAEDEMTIYDSLTLTIYSPLYNFFPDQINVLLKIKEDDKYKQSNAVNLLFIPVYTTFIESVLSELFNEYLRKMREESTNDFEKRLIDDADEVLRKGTWKHYLKLFHTVFGMRMNEVVSDENVNAIVQLFAFRNQTIHGKQILHTIENRDEEEEKAYMDGHYKSLNAFFLEKKLITKEELSSITFINDKILDYFFGNIIAFVTALSEKIIKPNRLQMDTILDAHVLRRLPPDNQPA
jgi:hypothetical protein